MKTLRSRQYHSGQNAWTLSIYTHEGNHIRTADSACGLPDGYGPQLLVASGRTRFRIRTAAGVDVIVITNTPDADVTVD